MNWSIPILLCFISLASLGNIFAQALDISSGGAPTITGAKSGSVTGSSNVLNDLVVTINFGEISPSNLNNIVKVVVPIAVRSNQAYKVEAVIVGTANANPQAVQPTDLGFGVRNMRVMGNQSRVCNNSNHIFYSPFNNDPTSNVTINASGRAAYPSTANNILTTTTILSGPRLSNGNANRLTTNGYIFDAIFAITPQYYAAGTTSATITFTISAGPNVPC
jgi:hypothetical protein